MPKSSILAIYISRDCLSAPMKYEQLEHTADVMVKAYGKDLDECFGNAAYALFNTMVDATTIVPTEEIDFVAEGHDYESLLYNFLSEFLFVHDVTRLVLCEFDVHITDFKIKCKARGERLDLEKHRPKTEIKAITYHMLAVDPETPSVTVIFDI
jgi:SHS2 domain-containing protein